MVRTALLTFFVCIAFSVCYGQDTLKKTAPVKTARTKVVQPKNIHRYPAQDSAAKRPYAAMRARTDSAYAQPTDKSLNGQYRYLLTRVYHYQQPLISALWQNASDTLKASRNQLKAIEKKLAAQSKTADSLQTQLQNAQSSNANVNDIDILGLTITKSTYNMVVWGIVAALVLTIVIIVNRSSSYRREARYRVQLYTELEEEFKNYKTKANDKEKKLARELQTERNKLDELLGRG